MTGNLVDGGVTVVFVGYLLSKYAASVLIRRLRQEHDGLWVELGRPSLWHLAATMVGNWRLTAFIWSGDAGETGDVELVSCVWAIRILDLAVLTATVVVLASVFGWHR